ncbi:helix-turn-helix transcriptional regulator [Lysobacter sp. CCNWLW3]|uniref:helix-turn-helix domain-containing protein n=1 Tax=unclassified Lysobacter TaxID=2635362 RepID=UPI002FD30F67
MDYIVRTVGQLEPLLKGFRKAKKYSQSTLANRLGISQQALSALEREPESASFSRLLQVLAALDVEILLRERKPNGDEGHPGSW